MHLICEKILWFPRYTDFPDIAVSFDGSWMTRGHKSHIGVGFVIDCETGFILDYQVLSNICREFESKRKLCLMKYLRSGVIVFTKIAVRTSMENQGKWSLSVLDGFR